MTEFRESFGLEACMRAITFEVEKLGKDPKAMLGEYIIRAEQDVFFNKKMIEAMKLYIRENDIRWNDITRAEFAQMAWKMSYNEYLACDCSRCRDLGLCPNLAK